MLGQEGAVLDAQDDVEGSLELLVADVGVALVDEAQELGHDWLVAVRERGHAGAQGILGSHADMTVVRGGLGQEEMDEGIYY